MRRLLFSIIFLAGAQHLRSDVLCRDAGGSVNGSWNGTTCSGAVRPVHYIVRNTGEDETQMHLLVQAIVDDAWRGDTIKFTAGHVFSIGRMAPISSVVINRRRGDSGYLTITTTEDDKLPAEGTRITPAYLPLMPIIQITGATFAFGLAGAGLNSADHIKFRGLYFRPASSTSTTLNLPQGFIRIGGSASGAYNTVAQEVSPSFELWSTYVTQTVNAGATRILLADASGVPADRKICIGYSGNSCEWVTVAAVNTTGENYIDIASGLQQQIVAGRRVYVPMDRPEYQPDDIIVQQNVFLNPFQGWQVGRFITLNSRSAVIRDNFFSAPNCSSILSDCQVILSTTGTGPHLIENNYIDGGSENILYGSSYSGINDTVNEALIRYNFFPHIPEREYVGPWALTQDSGYGGSQTYSGVSVPGLPPLSPRLVFTGRYVHKTGIIGAPYFRAMNTGVTGTVEPDFSSLVADGQYIYDGDPSRAGYGTTLCGGIVYEGDGVCWMRHGNRRNFIKNNFELKSGKNITLQYNVFDWHGSMHPYNAQQAYMIAIKNTGHEGFDGGCLNGGSFPACYRSATYNLKILNNIMRSHSGGILLVGNSTKVAASAIGDYTLRNNLFIQNERPLTNNTGGYLTVTLGESDDDADITSGSRTIPLPNVVIENNTFFSLFPNRGGSTNGFKFPMSFGGTGSTGGFPGGRMAGNIWLRGEGGATAYAGRSSGTDGGIAVFTHFPGIDQGGVWGKNIILGSASKATNYPPDTVWTGCPDTNSCITSYLQAPDWSGVFQNPTGGDYSLREDQWGKRAMPDGADVGADTTQLPEIRNLDVDVSDRVALFRWRVTQPIEHIPCVIEVHTAPDFESPMWHGRPAGYAGETGDVGNWYRQDADDAFRNTRSGLDRMISVGAYARLEPSTTYYYRLHCGGDVRRGSFETGEAVDGITEQTISRTIATESAKRMEVVFNTSYNRTADTFSGETAAADCDFGQSCSVSFQAPRGSIVYYRWIERDDTGAAVLSSDVQTLLVR